MIGNGTYTKVARLDNPKNDAAAMEAMFKAAAFTLVVRLEDLGVTAMKRALRDFSGTALDADIAAVFYAGHGIEVAGVNYLIPIDAVLERDIDVQDEAVSLDRINQVLEGATMAFAHRGGAASTLLLLLLGGPASAQQVWSVLGRYWLARHLGHVVQRRSQHLELGPQRKVFVRPEICR